MSADPAYAAAATGSRWDAADYHQFSSEQQKWARELIAKLRLRPHEHVLDIGCGDGKITAEIARAVPAGRVVGVDRAEDMIRFAQREFGDSTNPRFRFALMDAGALTFAGEFDAVFSNAVLHWVRDHCPVLAGIARALKPGGRVLLQMGGEGNAASVLAAAEHLLAQPSWREYFSDFTCPYCFYAPSAYREWLVASGLRPVRAELIPKDMVQTYPDGLAGWLRTTWWPYPQRVPEELRAEFMAELLAACAQRHPPDAQGRVHLPMVRLEVEAVKPM